MATIIASQAVITGAYSLTRQAIQLRLLPRLKIRHTSETQEGQIYLPSVNALLLMAVLALVVGFGIVVGLGQRLWHQRDGHDGGDSGAGADRGASTLGLAALGRAAADPPFLLIDLIFLGANMLKVFGGGYVPLAHGRCCRDRDADLAARHRRSGAKGA